MASDYYAALLEFASAHSHYAYGMIFLLAFSELVPVIGTFVPGSNAGVRHQRVGDKGRRRSVAASRRRDHWRDCRRWGLVLARSTVQPGNTLFLAADEVPALHRPK